MEIFINFIKELGFPIFVAVWCLVRMEPTLSKLNISIAKLLEHLNTKDI